MYFYFLAVLEQLTSVSACECCAACGIAFSNLFPESFPLIDHVALPFLMDLLFVFLGNALLIPSDDRGVHVQVCRLSTIACPTLWKHDNPGPYTVSEVSCGTVEAPGISLELEA